MNFLKKSSKILLLTPLASCEEPVERPEYALWFERPAEYFEESFVMGNGKMGASRYVPLVRQALVTRITGWPTALTVLYRAIIQGQADRCPDKTPPIQGRPQG